MAYVDADHKQPEGSSLQAAFRSGAQLEYTDKITHHRFEVDQDMGPFQYRPMFNNVDAVIVNGNHFSASRQVVVIDPRKEESLSRKLDRLTDVQLILLAEGVTEPYPFLKENISNIEEIPVLKLADIEGIIAFFKYKMQNAPPPLNGLVLAGGKSQRMGEDKGLLDFHGMPQRQFAARLLDDFCEKTFLSFRPDQMGESPIDFPALQDTFIGLGPMGAILSAFREKPDVAWLVVACDLPLLDQSVLDFLVKNRNPSQMATAFRSPVNAFPEPLIAIWEPRSYPVLLQFLAQGYSCPRKVLINSPVELLEAPNPLALKNVNTPEELAEVRERLKKHF